MQQRQVGFGEAINLAIAQNYCNFSGRASRSEYWWYTLFTVIVGFALNILTIAMGSSFMVVLMFLVYLGLFLPGLGICVRRLHDIGRSGWSILFSLIPIVGAIILLVWFLKPSQETENQYGAIPNCN